MKILLIFTAVVFGLMILFSQAWAESPETQFGGLSAQGGQPELQQPDNALMVEQQQLQSERDSLLAQNQQMQQDMVTYQQQNDALIAQQQQLQRERDAVALQNQQMQYNLTALQSGYQQLNGQNQALQAEFAADKQMDTTNLALAFWAGAAVLLVVSSVIVTAAAFVQSLSLRQPQSSEAQPEPFVTLEPNPWASREYRDRAIQKARLIEQWERRSLQVSQRGYPASVVNNQRSMKQNTA